MEIKIDYYCGDHTNCTDPKSRSCLALGIIVDLEAKTKFIVLLHLLFNSFRVFGMNLQRCFTNTNVLKQQILLKDCMQLEENGLTNDSIQANLHL